MHAQKHHTYPPTHTPAHTHRHSHASGPPATPRPHTHRHRHAHALTRANRARPRLLETALPPLLSRVDAYTLRFLCISPAPALVRVAPPPSTTEGLATFSFQGKKTRVSLSLPQTSETRGRWRQEGRAGWGALRGGLSGVAHTGLRLPPAWHLWAYTSAGTADRARETRVRLCSKPLGSAACARAEEPGSETGLPRWTATPTTKMISEKSIAVCLRCPCFASSVAVHLRRRLSREARAASRRLPASERLDLGL